MFLLPQFTDGKQHKEGELDTITRGLVWVSLMMIIV